jgi:hypothetical protein
MFSRQLLSKAKNVRAAFKTNLVEPCKHFWDFTFHRPSLQLSILSVHFWPSPILLIEIINCFFEVQKLRVDINRCRAQQKSLKQQMGVEIYDSLVEGNQFEVTCLLIKSGNELSGLPNYVFFSTKTTK